MRRKKIRPPKGADLTTKKIYKKARNDLKRKSRRLTRPEHSSGRDSLKTLLKRFAGCAVAPYLLSPGLRVFIKGFFYFKKKKPAAPYFPPYRSIIGAGVLDFRVRNGNGYIHPTMATGILNTSK